MNVQDLREDINKLLNEIENEVVLEAYLEILKNMQKVQQQQIMGYSVSGEAITNDSLGNKLKEAKDRMENGKYISNDDLKNEAENW